MTLPVAVIVPRLASRDAFFRDFCLPAVAREGPAELVTLNGDGPPGSKRNLGASLTSEPYLFFLDDDCVLRPGMLAEMVRLLEAEPEAAFAYGDFENVLRPETRHLYGGRHVAGPFDAMKLRRGNYVSTMSLLRRSAFPGFDEAIGAFEEWDLWLTIVERGGRGIYIPEVTHESHHIDQGLHERSVGGPWHAHVRAKHGLP